MQRIQLHVCLLKIRALAYNSIKYLLLALQFKYLYKKIRSEQSPESEGSLGDQYGGRDPGLNQGYIIRRAVLRQPPYKSIHGENLGQEAAGDAKIVKHHHLLHKQKF